MKTAIINYGLGNLSSVQKAFISIGAEPFVADNPKLLYEADNIILPGVGSFFEAMKNLKSQGWTEAIYDTVLNQKKPILGICLGMQMLASFGEEGGECEGLNLVGGKVVNLNKIGCSLTLPHIGWNDISQKKPSPLLEDISDNMDFYFLHSFGFVLDDKENLVATTNYGVEITAAIQKENIFGCQFHPEKSSKLGKQILKNFLEFKPF